MKQWLLRDVSFINDKGSASVISLTEEGQINIEPLVSTNKIFISVERAELEHLVDVVEDGIKKQEEMFNESTDEKILKKYLSFENNLLSELKERLKVIE